MNSKIKTIFIFIIIGFALIITSCTEFIENDFEFLNNSSYDLTIAPNGQDWQEFILSSGTSRILTINDKSVYFIYNYAGLVQCDTTRDLLVIFSNK